MRSFFRPLLFVLSRETWCCDKGCVILLVILAYTVELRYDLWYDYNISRDSYAGTQGSKHLHSSLGSKTKRIKDVTQ